MKTKKLSKAQQTVIDLMNEGWEMGVSKGYYSRIWLQKNGVGKGGESKNVHLNTFCALRDIGLIEINREGYPTDVYGLK